jgi:hypothetical protein
MLGGQDRVTPDHEIGFDTEIDPDAAITLRIVS